WGVRRDWAWTEGERRRVDLKTAQDATPREDEPSPIFPIVGPAIVRYWDEGSQRRTSELHLSARNLLQVLAIAWNKHGTDVPYAPRHGHPSPRHSLRGAKAP